MRGPFHIVTTLQETRGNELHALDLRRLLVEDGAEAQLWSDRASPAVARFGARVISPFSGAMPRGGTLILLGIERQLDPWIDYARPQRLIVIYNTSHTENLYRLLANLVRTSLPPAELVCVSQRLRAATGLPAYIAPPLIDMARFQPGPERDGKPFTIGRHSRDTPDKHHPQDVSLYRLLAWQGVNIRIMGGTCLRTTLAVHPEIELLAAGSEPAATFLQGLDVFFYRTGPDLHEAAGRIVIEALACGIPVVAHISGGYTDWIEHGKNGFLFSSQEEAWEQLCLLRHNPDLHAAMGLAARQSAEDIAGMEARLAYRQWLTS